MKAKKTNYASMSEKDIEQAVTKYRNKLKAKVAEAKLLLDNKEVGTAIQTVFDRYGDVAITMPALATMTCGELNATSDNYKSLHIMVCDYIRSADWLMVTKGRGGGVRCLRPGAKRGMFGATCNSRIIDPK